MANEKIEIPAGKMVAHRAYLNTGTDEYPAQKKRPRDRAARLRWANECFRTPLFEAISEVLGELEDAHASDEDNGFDMTDRYDTRQDRIDKLQEMLSVIEDLETEIDTAFE